METKSRPRRDFAALEARRMAAAKLFSQGIWQAEVARRLGVSRETARRWYGAWQAKGKAGLKGAGRAGRRPRLDASGLKRVEAALLQGADAWGFRTHLWTLERVCQVIWRTCHVRYSVPQAWRILKALGWSRQRPARRAKERDDKAIAHWKRIVWPRIKKSPQAERLDWFLDESGFSQRPPVRATWAPKGQTPILKEPFNWKTLSAIGLLLLDPTLRRFRWVLDFHPGSIRSAQVVRFLKALRQHRRKKVILIWDRLQAHRSRETGLALNAHRAWLGIEWLPPYAHELNPVEPLWDWLDNTALANTPMDRISQIPPRVRGAIRRLENRPQLTYGFLKYTGLY